MSTTDFDVQSLAAYLHLTPEQVLRMAQRNRLPGRRVGGDWRFSEAEIHHWLEEKIGASDSEELLHYQAVLDRHAEDFELPLRIAELCTMDRIAVPLAARTRSSVIRTMCELAASDGMLWDAAAMNEAVEAREQMHPTALENGVALLHPRRPQTSILAESVLALGVCPQPLPFSDAGHLTDLFFLICSYDDRSHLRILARLSRLVSNPALLGELRNADSAQTAHEAIRLAELQAFGDE